MTVSEKHKQNDSLASKANPMWGGHYAQGASEIMATLNASIGFDNALYAYDIRGSLAHVAMLANTGIVTQDEAKRISDGLNQINAEIADGQMQWQPELEDIHMHIEARLKELIGDVAGKLHTARSRNDQVATDIRLYLRQNINEVKTLLQGLNQTLLAVAEQHTDTIMPGFTHLQTAQPVTFAHHLMAYHEMFLRDYARFSGLVVRVNECPLGAAALAGTSFPIDRKQTASSLGFARPCRNSLDAVASRDVAIEYISHAAICVSNLSRLAEELVVWSSALVKFITLPESLTSGSSIMPQKRNPDAAELIRAKTGRINGNLIQLLTVIKGTPLAYNKDLQEDKEPVFDTTQSLRLCLLAMNEMIADLTVHKEAMLEAAKQGYSTATDLADWLVRELGIAFRDAHHITGRIVGLAERQACYLWEISLEEMQSVERRITQDIYTVLSVEHSVASRHSFGGTAPVKVHEAIKAAKEHIYA